MRIHASILTALFLAVSARAMPPPAPYFAVRDMAFRCKLELLQLDTLNVASYAILEFGWKKGEQVGGISKAFPEINWEHHEMVLDPFGGRMPAKAVIAAPKDLNLAGRFEFYFHSESGAPQTLWLRGKLAAYGQQYDDAATLVSRRPVEERGALQGRIETNRDTATVFRALHRELEIVCTEKP